MPFDEAAELGTLRRGSGGRRVVVGRGVDVGGGGNFQWGLGSDGEGGGREARYLERDLVVWRLDADLACGGFGFGSLGQGDQPLSLLVSHFTALGSVGFASASQESLWAVHPLSAFFNSPVFLWPPVQP